MAFLKREGEKPAGVEGVRERMQAAKAGSKDALLQKFRAAYRRPATSVASRFSSFFAQGKEHPSAAVVGAESVRAKFADWLKTRPVTVSPEQASRAKLLGLVKPRLDRLRAARQNALGFAH